MLLVIRQLFIDIFYISIMTVPAVIYTVWTVGQGVSLATLSTILLDKLSCISKLTEQLSLIFTFVQL